MLSPEQCRKFDPSLKKLPDKEVSEIRDELFLLAQLAFNSYLSNNSVSKNPERLLSDTSKSLK